MNHSHSLAGPARGSYSYLLNGSETDIREDWELLGSAADLTVRSRRHVPTAGISLEVESRQCEGAFRSCSVRWRDASGEVHADYRFCTNSISIERTQGSSSTSSEEPSAGIVFSPLMRIYTGPVIAALCSVGGSGRVMVPWIRDPTERARLLTPLHSERRATFIGNDRLTIAGRRIRCRCFEYSGGEYPPGTHFWVDRHRVLLRYQWQQDSGNRWEVRLREYQRPTPA